MLIALAAWAAAVFAQRPSWDERCSSACCWDWVARPSSPLAVAAGLSAAGVCILAVAAIRRRHFAREEAANAVRGIVIGVAALLTFIASYPYLWTDPITHTRHLFAFRVEEMAAQSSDWPVMAVPNRVEALRRINFNFTERYNLTAAVISLFGGPKTAPLVRQAEFLLPLLGIALMAGLAIRDGPYRRARWCSPSSAVRSWSRSSACALSSTATMCRWPPRRGRRRRRPGMAGRERSVAPQRQGPAGARHWEPAALKKRDGKTRTNEHVGDDQERLAGAHQSRARPASATNRSRNSIPAPGSSPRLGSRSTLAECADGDQAKALISLISEALADGENVSICAKSIWNSWRRTPPRHGRRKSDKRLDRNETAPWSSRSRA